MLEPYWRNELLDAPSCFDGHSKRTPKETGLQRLYTDCPGIRASRPSREPQTQALYALDIDLRRIGAMFVTPARRRQDGQLNPETAFTSTDAEVKFSDVFDPVVSYDPPCAETCIGINWYCRNNPRAYESK